MIIAKITESDLFGGEPEYIEDNTRYNVRGVLTDGKGNIAVMKINDSEFFKLPGGSIDITETPENSFLRDVNEQTGYTGEIVGYLGWIEEHKKKKKFCMVSHCYIAKCVSDEKDEELLAQTEEKLGYTLLWIPYSEAVDKLNSLAEECKEYQMSFVLRRDSLILGKAEEFLN